jgi:hypothetical protein
MHKVEGEECATYEPMSGPIEMWTFTDDWSWPMDLEIIVSLKEGHSAKVSIEYHYCRGRC